jgi:ParB family chromosome partitioning protein
MTAAKKTTDEKVQQIPVEQLYLSPGETRKTLDQAALKELAASIALNGVLEALLVRPLPVDGWKSLPDEIVSAHSSDTLYEIVAGQRRHAASKIAGKATCPCIVREMSDAEAAELRIISNLQREDLSPLEEALAFKALLAVPGATIETVAAKLAKLASYVARRLKLLDAIEPVRDALKAGAIEVGHALELARLAESQQLRLLSRMDVGFNYTSPDEDEEAEGFEQADEQGVCKFCRCTEDDACRLDGGVNCSWMDAEQTVCSNPDCVAQYKAEQEGSTWTPTAWSVAQLRSEISRTTLRVLAGAPFPLDDELPPMACTECPKRSGNAALLFEDCAQDTCTDRECFDAKLKVWVKAELDAADSEKRKLVMLADGWTENRSAVSKWDVTVIPDQTPIKPCDCQEEAIYINGGRIGHRTMICRDAKCKIHASGNSGSRIERSVDPVKAKAERKHILEKVRAAKAYRTSLLAALSKADIPAAAGDALNLGVCAEVVEKMSSIYAGAFADALGWDRKLFDWSGKTKLREKLQGMKPLERMRVALLATEAGQLSVSEYNVSAKPEGLEKIAKLLNVDVKKVAGGLAANAKPESRAKPSKADPKKAAAKPAPKKPAAKKAAKKKAAKR